MAASVWDFVTADGGCTDTVRASVENTAASVWDFVTAYGGCTDTVRESVENTSSVTAGPTDSCGLL